MKTFIVAIKLFLLMTLLTGVIYPLGMTGISQMIFPEKANGSLVYMDGQLIGSELIGQKFDSILYFWPRPSAIDYNPVPSSGSNLGPTSMKLKDLVEERRTLLMHSFNVSDKAELPVEMLFASASGLDPHISPEAAFMQTERVVAVRNFNELQHEKLLQLITTLIEPPQFFFLGQPRINVFKLNLALDTIR
jgi:K+-transporting ATPase ATPase C chain